MIRDKYKKNKSGLFPGFTLMELTMSLVILAIVLPALLTGFISCLGLNEMAKNTIVATEHIRSVIEQMHSLSNTSLSSITTVEWDEWLNSTSNYRLPSEQVEVSYPDYDSDNLTVDDDPLAVMVNISWQEIGRTRNLNVFTLLTAQ